MQRPPPEHIAIIGGGFSGLMVAVNLARLSPRPLAVTLINHRRPTGRGVAYGMRRPEYLLNVAARNMSAFPDEPDHFLQWLRTRAEFDEVPEATLRERFIPRMVYGDYLRSLMLHHLQGVAGGGSPVRTEFVDGEATDIEPVGEAARVCLADGKVVVADRVVLATGNEAPATLPGAETLTNHPAWVADPWQPWWQRLPEPGGTIVVLGTGLTTVDVIVSLRALGWTGQVHAVSRHGWLPRPHFRGIEYPDFPPAGVDLAGLGLAGLVTLVEQHAARLRERAANPALLVDKLRPHTQHIWGRFTREEKLTFVREHAARWSIHRHRIAPEIHEQVAEAQRTKLLRVHAAGIARVEAAGSQVRVHTDDGQCQTGDLVINATGPATRLTATRSGLLRNLLRRGLVVPDDTDMGVRVEPDHTVVTGDGTRASCLLAMGPLLRGTLWETIAVPELRAQARRVAETLLDQLAPTGSETSAMMMEYMI